MALHTLQRGMRARQRIVRIRGVIEVDVRPVSCAVARVAGRRECRSRVVRIGRSLPVRLMTPIAGRR